MSANRSPLRLVLAVDPFAEDAVACGQALASAAAPFLAAGRGTAEAIFLMSPTSLSLTEKGFSDRLVDVRTIAEKAVRESLAGLPAQTLKGVHAVAQLQGSTRELVDALLQRARHDGADMIVACTHSRKGIDRFFLGSFVETLLLRSELPVLVTRPRGGAARPYDRILFATDLEPDTIHALSALRDHATRLGAKVTLFHAVHPVSVILPPPGYVAEKEWEESIRERRDRAIALAEELEGMEVAVDTDVVATTGNVATAVADAVERSRAGLVCVPTRQRPRLAMGGVPRQVIRSSTVPVLTMPLGNAPE